MSAMSITCMHEVCCSRLKVFSDEGILPAVALRKMWTSFQDKDCLARTSTAVLLNISAMKVEQ